MVFIPNPTFCEVSATPALRQKWSVANTFLGVPDCSAGINDTLAIERRGGRGGGGPPNACTSCPPVPTTLEQRIARRPEETSRAEARLVHSSSPRNHGARQGPLCGIERTLIECITTSQFDPATDIPLPTGWRRADYTNWLGKPHDADAFRGEVRWSDASRPRHAQAADRLSPVNGLLTNAA